MEPLAPMRSYWDLTEDDLIAQQYNDLVENKYIDDDMLNYMNIDDTQKFNIKKELVNLFNSSVQKKWYEKTKQQIPIQFLNRNIVNMLNLNNLPPFLTKTLDQYLYMRGEYDEYLADISGTTPPGPY